MNIRRTLAAVIMTMCLATPVDAEGFLDNLGYDLRLGYSVGGSTPLGMPATIRSLDSYRLEPNFKMGLGVYKQLHSRWGLASGIFFENKGMNIRATVKNYHIAIVRGGQSLEGNFTGKNSSVAEQWMLTLPLQATYSFNDNVRLKLGPYLSYVSSHSFTGYASDGYLRVGSPTGTKVELGHEEGTRGSYDFSDEMRRLQFGFAIGADCYVCRHWGVFADLSWGVTGVFKSSFHTIEQTLYPIYFTVGAAYRFK